MLKSQMLAEVLKIREILESEAKTDKSKLESIEFHVDKIILDDIKEPQEERCGL